jgi:hypothetical protein
VVMSGGNQDLILYLGDRALQSVDGLTTYFALQRRHPDGRRWVEIAAFVSRDDAEAALEGSVKHGAAERAEVRVTKVTREPTP